MSAQGSSVARTLGSNLNVRLRVVIDVAADPRVVAALQPWADISERLRRN